MRTSADKTAVTKASWFRFSLNNVFLLFAVFSVALSIYVAHVQQQWRSLAIVRKLGGRADYKVVEDPIAPKWLTQLTKNEYSISVSDLCFTSGEFSDEDMQHIAGFRDLQRLNLTRTRITDAGLIHLQGLENLNELLLCNTEVTDAGLVYLESLTSLRTLYLNQTDVTEEGVDKLQ